MERNAVGSESLPKRSRMPSTATLVKLPRQKIFKQKSGVANAWSDHYGALHTAAAYCGIALPLRPFTGIWQHGCFGPWDAISPELLTYSTPDGRRLPVFVGREDQGELLLKAGYLHARAIGLPIVYCRAKQVERRPGSLLVMPAHSLAGRPFATTAELDEYARMIAGVSGDFSETVACIHPGCKENGHWLKEFGTRGIPTIDGARTDDANALSRMLSLFSQFEFVTTNGWGSHVAYALYCGAKVSICGAVPARDPESVLKDAGWGEDVEAINYSCSPQFAALRDKYLEKYYLAPQEGVQDVEYGRWLVGEKHRLPPAELKKLFGWSLSERLSYVLSMAWF